MLREDTATEIVVRRPRRLRGEAHVPGDKSISHRSIFHNAIASGAARVENLGPGDDVRSTAAAMRALGVQIDDLAPNAYLVHGRGPGLGEADDVIDAEFTSSWTAVGPPTSAPGPAAAFTFARNPPITCWAAVL